MGDHNGPTRGVTGPPRSQGDGRKYLLHALTAIISVAVSLGGASAFIHGTPGATGPAGKTVIASQAVSDQPLGVCAYFGPDKNGVSRFQLSQPVKTTGGTHCTKGVYVSVVPRQ